MPRRTIIMAVVSLLILGVAIGIFAAAVVPKSTQVAVVPTPTDAVNNPSTLATEDAQLATATPDLIATQIAGDDASATAQAGPDLVATEQAVKTADADIATAEAAPEPSDTDTPIPADTATDVPTSDTSVQIVDTNTGNATDALIGASIKDWIARFGQPHSPGFQFSQCADGSFNYVVGAQAFTGAMYSPDVITPDGKSTTQVVIQITGNQCDSVGRSEQALLNDAAQFFPPDASAPFSQCGDDANMDFYYHSDLLTSRAMDALNVVNTIDCNNQPLPSGTFSVNLSKDSDGQWDSTWVMYL